MKICFIGDGTSIHTQRWIDYLSKTNDIFLVTTKPDKKIKVKQYILKGNNPLFSKGSNYRVCYSFNAIKQLKKIIRKEKPDVVHAHFVSHYGVLAAFAKARPLVLSTLGSDVFVAPKKSFIINFLVKYALRHADIIHVHTKYLKGYISKFVNADKIRLIPWGADLKPFKKDYSKEIRKLKKRLNIKNQKIILSYRRLDSYFNMDKIIKSIPAIIKKHPDVILVFMWGSADKSYEKKMGDLVKKLKISKYVRFAGYEETRNVPPYLKMADIMIMIPPTEGGSISLFESMACGLIPVVSDIPTNQEWIKDGYNGFLVNVDNQDAINLKISKALSNIRLKGKFYKINKAMVQNKGDFDRNMLKVYQIYKELE